MFPKTSVVFVVPARGTNPPPEGAPLHFRCSTAKNVVFLVPARDTTTFQAQNGQNVVTGLAPVRIIHRALGYRINEGEKIVPDYYPAMLDIRGRVAIVIGGERVAAGKAAALAASGGHVNRPRLEFF